MFSAFGRNSRTQLGNSSVSRKIFAAVSLSVLAKRIRIFRQLMTVLLSPRTTNKMYLWMVKIDENVEDKVLRGHITGFFVEYLYAADIQWDWFQPNESHWVMSYLHFHRQKRCGMFASPSHSFSQTLHSDHCLSSAQFQGLAHENVWHIHVCSPTKSIEE